MWSDNFRDPCADRQMQKAAFFAFVAMTVGAFVVAASLFVPGDGPAAGFRGNEKPTGRRFSLSASEYRAPPLAASPLATTWKRSPRRLSLESLDGGLGPVKFELGLANSRDEDGHC